MMNINSVNDDSEDEEDDGLDMSLFPSVHDPSMAVKAPEDNDVICGRGKSVSHPGNLKFRQLVLNRKDEYMQAKRREDKTRIATEIVEELRNSQRPSRYAYIACFVISFPRSSYLTPSSFLSDLSFLLKDVKTNLWFDVGEVYAREKVSHALRSRPNEERRRKLRPKKKTCRKSEIPMEFEAQVESLIQSQQKLLKTMIETEMFPPLKFDAPHTGKSPV